MMDHLNNLVENQSFESHKIDKNNKCYKNIC